MRMLLVVALIAATACGSSPSTPLDPGMAGTWVGTTLLTIGGVASGTLQTTSSQQSQVVLTVSGESHRAFGAMRNRLFGDRDRRGRFGPVHQLFLPGHFHIDLLVRRRELRLRERGLRHGEYGADVDVQCHRHFGWLW